MTGSGARRTQRDIDRQLSPWTRRRIAAWALFAVAALVAIQHMLAHLGWRPLPFAMGLQDLLIGYPMAGVLAIVGLVALGPARPR